jgi:hypothetical protein
VIRHGRGFRKEHPKNTENLSWNPTRANCVSAGDTISTVARGGWPSAAVAGGKSTERQAPRPNAAGQKAVPGELLGGRDEKQSRDEEA